MNQDVGIDYTTWDWLPKAATEIEAYVVRLLEESGIRAHDVSARAKSIASFHRKQQLKDYANPMRQITDILAIRIITYSITDRDRTGDLICGRFVVVEGEDKNPGDVKDDSRRGYDCRHIVVSGEVPGIETDWLVSGGKLAKYFKEFGGLEIQIRTVAGHAWAEFEHARRYKGVQYGAVNEQDQGTIDQLFGAASDARRALDETFVAIDRILARPSDNNVHERIENFEVKSEPVGSKSPLDLDSLAHLLATRFPDDKEPSEKGVSFGLELALACDLNTVESLESALQAVDSEQVVALMDASGPVTRVRRLDDELLARFEESFIDRTGQLGSVSTRSKQLEWRFDRLRGKVRYKAYFIQGEDRPDAQESGPLTAAGSVRALACLVAQREGVDAVVALEEISRANDLPKGARAKEVPVNPRESIWVTTNLNREYSEYLMRELLARVPSLDLIVMRHDTVVASTHD